MGQQITEPLLKETSQPQFFIPSKPSADGIRYAKELSEYFILLIIFCEYYVFHRLFISQKFSVWFWSYYWLTHVCFLHLTQILA